jgi:hypothetical protein
MFKKLIIKLYNNEEKFQILFCNFQIMFVVVGVANFILELWYCVLGPTTCTQVHQQAAKVIVDNKPI